MKDQIRAEFEQQFPLPNGVTFDGDHYLADPNVMGSFQNATIWSHMYRGWKAKSTSLKSLSVEIEQDIFEERFPMPMHCMRFKGGYAATEYSAWEAHKFCDRWEGWKARSSIVRR